MTATGFSLDSTGVRMLAKDLPLGTSFDVSALYLTCCGFVQGILMLSYPDTEKEISNSTPPRHLWDFLLALGDSGLFDVAFSGHPFTWCNNKEHPNTVWKRLDRACTNTAWNTTWPETRVSHFRRIYSDLAPIDIHCEKERPVWSKRGNRSIRFEACWIKSEECERVLSHLWEGQLILTLVGSYCMMWKDAN
ncbi:UNVERIFIED_CONTAM: hypothetical protein Sradi_5116000 [Sesamum radiatum]|uniref:Uncharacterized protein n=1 Tax=Sesamum radiatum TaxID=300843 RepID=A0AAW2M528_SESRA